MGISVQKIATHSADAGSVGTIIVSWLGVMPLIVSTLASLVATGWVIQRWVWMRQDRKAKRKKA